MRPIQLRTTTPETHISDFRSQKRSDSRADKPLVYNHDIGDFDFTNKSKIQDQDNNRLMARREIYTNIIGTFVRNVRGRFENAVDRLAKSRTLRQEPARIIRPVSLPLISKEPQQNDTDDYPDNIVDIPHTTDFEGLTLDSVNELQFVEMDEENNSSSTEITDPAKHKRKDIIFQTILNVFGLKNHPLRGDDQNSTNPRIEAVKNFTKLIFQKKKETFDEILLNPLIESIVRSVIGNKSDNPSSEHEITEGLQSRLDEYYAQLRTQNATSDARNLDSYGILMLEFFGTIVGLTWGAISQIQGFFMGQ